MDIVFQPLPVGMSVEPVFSMSLAGEKQLLSSFLCLESGPDITFLLPSAREDRLLLRLVVSLSIGISGLPILPCGSLSPKVPIESAFFSPPFRICWTSRAPLTKHHRLTPQTDWLIQQKCISSGFWRLETQDQVACLVSPEALLLDLQMTACTLRFHTSFSFRACSTALYWWGRRS